MAIQVWPPEEVVKETEHPKEEKTQTLEEVSAVTPDGVGKVEVSVGNVPTVLGDAAENKSPAEEQIVGGNETPQVSPRRRGRPRKF